MAAVYTKELIDAMAMSNAVEAQSTFNLAVTERIAKQLDDMRVDVAQSMFKTSTTEAE